MTRRDFLKMLAAANVAGLILPSSSYAGPDVLSGFYDVPPFGQLTLMHMTDCHAQLVPTYFREPNINIGIGEANGRLPHAVGDKLLKYMGFKPGSIYAHAFSHLEFTELSQLYGKIGGFAHLATVIKHLRGTRPGRTLLLGGGDTWQGLATALWTNAQDMIDATKLLGVDIMTGHWEFTYGADRVKEGRFQVPSAKSAA